MMRPFERLGHSRQAATANAGRRKIELARAATAEMNALLGPALAELTEAAGLRNRAGVYLDAARVRIALVKARRAIGLAQQLEGLVDWPEDGDYQR